MSKQIKNRLLSELSGEIGNLEYAILVDASALSGNEANALRRGLRESGVSARTMKSSFARKILNENGSAGASKQASGPTTVVWGGEDVVALSREITKWAKELSKLKILGGGIGRDGLVADDVDKLSKSPGRAELLSNIAGLLLAPGGQLAAAINGPGGKLVSAIGNTEDRTAV